MYNYFDKNENGYSEESNHNVIEKGFVLINPPEASKVKTKKKPNFKTYISLVLVASLVSSTVVGSILYSKFSGELKKGIIN